MVLAGGRGRRLGQGGKAHVALAGRPMLDWPLEALRAELDRVAVVAKAATRLPPLPPGVELWQEPDEPQHPLTGLTEALRRAEGAPVVACAVDLPLVDAATIRALIGADGGEEESPPALVARAGDRWQPLLARYTAAALPGLLAAGPQARLLDVVRALGAHPLSVPAGVLLNVNDAEDLARAARALAARAAAQPNVNA